MYYFNKSCTIFLAKWESTSQRLIIMLAYDGKYIPVSVILLLAPTANLWMVVIPNVERFCGRIRRFCPRFIWRRSSLEDASLSSSDVDAFTSSSSSSSDPEPMDDCTFSRTHEGVIRARGGFILQILRFDFFFLLIHSLPSPHFQLSR